MSEISNFIKMLQDKDDNKRFEACEKLRVWGSALPQEAIDALIIATSDTNSDVADSAERALALHTSNAYNPKRKNPSASSTSKFNTGIVGAIIMIVAVWCIATIPTDSSPESYEIRGNLMFAAVVLSPILIIVVLLGIIPATIASKKGHNFLLWWIFGVTLFIVALPLAILVKPNTKEIERNQI